MNRLILILALLPLLPACERAKEELGLTRRLPDEFAVVRRAPLEIPPNLGQVSSLPPPVPGAPRPQEESPQEAAQAAVLGGAAMSAQAPSRAESALLERAGAAQADSRIRAVVNRENEEDAEDNRPVVKRIMNIGNEKDPGPATIVDAPAEARRLKQNRQSGQAPTRGETPTIDD